MRRERNLETKTVYIPLWGNRIIRLEKWLSEQAARGWIVEKIDLRGFHFVKRKPRTRTYMFYKSVGRHSKRDIYDPVAGRIGRKITSSFVATNTVKVCASMWNLASFVPDAGHEIYRELLIQRNCYLIKEAICMSIFWGIFALISLLCFVFSLGKNAGYAVMGGILSLCGILCMITWLDAYVKLSRYNRMIQQS